MIHTLHPKRLPSLFRLNPVGSKISALFILFGGQITFAQAAAAAEGAYASGPSDLTILGSAVILAAGFVIGAVLLKRQ